MADEYRLFVAIEIAADVRAELIHMQEQLRRSGAAIRWVAPATMHLTLFFLGDTSVSLLEPIRAALAAVAAEHRVFRLQLDRAGAFPNLRQPRVVWSGISGDTPALERLQRAVAAALESQGIPQQEHGFRAHMTLGRARQEAAPAQLAQLGGEIRALPPPPMLAWDIEQLVLFRSQLRPGGPLYTAIAQWPLRRSAP